MEIINLVGTLPVYPKKKYSIRATSFIKVILVHHTGAGSSLQDAQAEMRTVESIASYHVMTKRWPGIAYHYVITRDGTTYKTNNVTTLSYHGGEGQNKKSLGVCLLGNFQMQHPTPVQIKALEDLLAEILRNLPGRKVVPHRAVRATVCPGEKLVQLLPGIVSAATAKATSPEEHEPPHV